MGLVTVDKKQLLDALDAINAAETRGFMHCIAVMHVPCGKHSPARRGRGYNLGEIRATYSDLWERAHPTDGNLDWGRHQNVSRQFVFNPRTNALEKRQKEN